MDSNEKARLIASLNLCFLEKTEGKVTGGICPAQNGEMAHVKILRRPNSIKIVSCVHHQFGGKNHQCEGVANGHVCYHAKTILIQAAEENGYQVCFSDKFSEGDCVLFNDPLHFVYMKTTKKESAETPTPEVPKTEKIAKKNTKKKK